MNFSVIKNGEDLATTNLRRDALEILEAGYRAILTKEVIEQEVTVAEDQLKIDGHMYSLSRYKRVFFVGIGKCALDAGEVFEQKLGAWITDGIILDVRGAPLKKIHSRVGTHPLPTEQNVEISLSIAEILESLTEDDLLITVVSGGASSLLCLPYDMSCEALARITKTLMEAGATIEELNTVRKHTSNIQGGQFAKLAFPATVVALIFSDVPGNDLGFIASGPTVKDATTVDDARAILVKYNVEKKCELPECNLVETPKEDEYFQNVHNVLLVTNHKALSAMKKVAEEKGYNTTIESEDLQGIAFDVGKDLIAKATDCKTCRLYGGETTVHVTQDGAGGRCQEAGLGALTVMKENTLLVAASSDGWDNTPFAGVIADTELLAATKTFGLSPEISHNENKSYDFFKRTGGHIDTGRTGANVSDWYFTITS